MFKTVYISMYIFHQGSLKNKTILKAIIKEKTAVNTPLRKIGVLCLCCPRWAETSLQAAKLATKQ
jgi:hypothetical protein